jgi:hypothetical protein
MTLIFILINILILINAINRFIMRLTTKIIINILGVDRLVFIEIRILITI